MTAHFSVNPHETIPSFDVREEQAQRNLFQRLLSLLKSGEPVEFPNIMQAHPQLRQYRSFVLDLVYEDYCQRTAVGETRGPDDYINTFPEYQSQITQLLEVHRFFHSTGNVPNWLTEQKIWPVTNQIYLGYKICAELGRGAIGRVYLAQELALNGRFVAVKVSPYGYDEAKLLAKIKHPNVIPINSVQEDPETGLTAVCMPYNGCTTLLDLISAVKNIDYENKTSAFWQAMARRGTGLENQPILIPDSVLKISYTDTVLELMLQIVRALVYVHEQKILHRDLKPSNILITPERKAMILDFNLSTDLTEIQNRIGGTLPYMAPEQIQQVILTPGIGPQLDERVDLYSVGVICYELLSGNFPYATDSTGSVSKEEAEEYVKKIKNDRIPKLSAIDKRTNDIVFSCLEFDPDKRPPSAKVLLAKLEACIKPTARWRRAILRHPRLAIATLAITCLVILGAIAIWAMQPTYESRQVALGWSKLAATQYDEARNHFQNAIANRTDFVEAWNGLSRTQYLSGDSVAAIKSLKSSYALNSDPRIAACIGYLYCLRNDLREGTSWLEIGKQQYPGCAEILTNLAAAKRLLGPTWQDESLSLYNAALAINPRLRPALLGRASVCFMLDKKNKTAIRSSILRDIDLAVSLPNSSAELLAYAAKYHLAANDPMRNDQLEIAKDYVLQALDKGLGFEQLESILFREKMLKESFLDKYRNQVSNRDRVSQESPWLDPWPILFGK